MANGKVTIEFGGDIKRLKSAVDEGVKQLSRLEAAQKKLMGGKVSTAEFTQFNTLNKQQLAEVQRIARERGKFAQQTALQEQRLAAQTSQVRERLDRQSAQSAQKINQQSAQFEIKTGLEKQRAAEKAELAKQRAAQQTAIQRERLAQQSAQFEIKNSQAVARAEDAARRRQVADFARAEREKTRIAQAETRNRFSFAKLGGKLNSAGQGIRNAGQTAAIGITAPIAAAAYGIISAGAEYEKALNTFQAVTKATNDEMAAAADTAKRLGADITLPATSAKDAALAMTELGKAGLSANQAMAASKGVLQLAAAGQIDEARAAEIAANALNSFKLQAIDTVRVADLLAAASNASSAEVGDIAEAMQQASAIFAGAKIPIEDLTSAISIMANAGIKGSDAGTSLKTFIQRLQSPTDNAADAMKNLGVQVFDAQGKMKALPDIIGQFDKALTGLTDEQKAQALNSIFGADAIRAAQILFTEGEAGFNKMKGAVTEVGAAAELAAAKTKGLGGAWDAFISQLETIGIDVYENIKTPLTDAVQLATQVVAQIGGAFSQLPPTVQTGIVVFTALVAAIAPVLIVVGSVALGISGLIAAFSGVAAAVAAVGGFVVVVPVLAAVGAALAVVGVAAAVLYEGWKQNIGGIQQTTSEVFNNVKSIIQPAIEEISAFIQQSLTDVSAFITANLPTIIEAVQNTVKYLEKIWSENGAQITEIVKATWEIVKAVVSAGASFIGSAILLVANVINGNWAGAWANFKAIVGNAVNASGAILKGLAIIVIQAIKLVAVRLVSIGAEIYTAALSIGKSIVQGLTNGISNLASSVYDKAKSVASGALSMIRGVFQTQSPSKVTTQIGQFVSEGLAIGIENKAGRVKSAAKKLADDTIAQLREAVKEFEKLSGASPEQVGRIQQADTIKNATGNQSEIIKLRGELGVNQFKSLPTTVSGTDRELKDLQAKKAAADDFAKSLDDIGEGYRQTQEIIEKSQAAFDDKIKAMEESGALALLQLQEEIDLTGVVDEKERQRITNLYDIKTLREQMFGDGFGQVQIDEAAEVLRLEQGRRQELESILNIRKQVAGAEGLGANLTDKLSGLQNGNRELSEYEKTLSKINQDYKDISPAQQESLLNTAKQVDAQKAYNEQYSKTYDFIRSSFDILTEKGKSFGDKMKSIFGGIANKFKKMLLDMAANWLTNKVMGGSSGSSGGGGGGASGSSLGGISGIIKNLFGGGQSGGTASLPNGGGLSALLGSNGGSNGSLSGLGRTAGAGSMLGGSSSSGGGGNIFSNLKGLFSSKDGGLFGKGGIFGEKGFGKNVGTFSAVGSGAALLGGLISSKFGGSAVGRGVGGVLSGAGSGLALGAQIGSIIPGIGTVIGAGVGALIGGIAGFFGSRGLRKKEQKLRAEYLQSAVSGLSGIDQIIEDVRALRVSPESGLASATALGSQLRAQYLEQANALKDNKTKRIALSSVSELDFKIRSKMDALRAVSDISQAAIERKNRILPEFAPGGFMDRAFIRQFKDFKRRNGMLSGRFDGRDTLPSMLAPGEMVLNPNQQERTKRAAGFDVFRHAEIPNYANGTFVAPVVSTPTFSAQAVNASPIVVNIIVEGEIDAARIKDVAIEGLGTEKGQRQIVTSIEKARGNNDFKSRQPGKNL